MEQEGDRLSVVMSGEEEVGGTWASVATRARQNSYHVDETSAHPYEEQRKQCPYRNPLRTR